MDTRGALTFCRGSMVALLAIALGFHPVAEAVAQNAIELERRVLRFVPSRPDMTVGIAWLSVFAPKRDWIIRPADRGDVSLQDAGPYKHLELKQVGPNSFDLPSTTIEATRRNAGPVCLSIKGWFNEVTNVYDSYYYLDPADRQALLSFCTRNDERLGPRQQANRVATLDAFRSRLATPLVLNLRRDIVPQRPGLFVDGQGTVYFQTVLIGRHTTGTLSHHAIDGWKLPPGGKPEHLALAYPPNRPDWRARMHDFARQPYQTLLRISALEPVATNAEGYLYARSGWCGKGSPQPLTQLVRIGKDGRCHELAGTAAGLRAITAIAAGRDGQVYVADGSPDAGSWIRRVAPDGTAVILAGSDRVGFADGPRAAARFHLPSGLAVDAAGVLYVADPVNSRVRMIALDGVVSIVAGGDGDARGSDALSPSGIAVGTDGGLYVLDSGPHRARVRLRRPDGRVLTLTTVDVESRKALVGFR